MCVRMQKRKTGKPQKYKLWTVDLQEVLQLWSVGTWYFDLMSSGKEMKHGIAWIDNTHTRLRQIKLMAHVNPYVLFKSKVKIGILLFSKSETMLKVIFQQAGLCKKLSLCLSGFTLPHPQQPVLHRSRVLTTSVCFPAHQRLFRKQSLCSLPPFMCLAITLPQIWVHFPVCESSAFSPVVSCLLCFYFC